MNHRVTTLLVLCFVALFGASSVQAQVTIKADVTSNTLWTSNNTYLLDGLIFVNEGATLTIEPGTVIKGLEQGSITTGDGASALIVRRGAKIHAEGTAAAPIVFTSELDDVANPTDLTQ
ncbi:T9SS C-terminal target domain-containing protein, partial [bacterium]|nr:T9SS C-terminal target domain-containing protein [bacterium]